MVMHLQMLLEFPKRQTSSAAEKPTESVEAITRCDAATQETIQPNPPTPALAAKWDFASSFPPPLEEALDAGVIDEADVHPPNLKTLHGEYQRLALQCFRDQDSLAEARRCGIDPSTKEKIQDVEQLKDLGERLSNQERRSDSTFDVLMETYAESFGQEAADQFRKVLRCRHHGIEVTTELPDAQAAQLGCGAQIPPMRVDVGDEGRVEGVSTGYRLKHRSAERTESATIGDSRLSELVLRWDFRTSFPEPRQDAIEAGKLEESDVQPANNKSLHLEFEREALALLADLDALADAKRRGIDPATGNPPRTAARKAAIEKRLLDEPELLERGLEEMMNAYQQGYGSDAGEEFRKAIFARHHGIEVLAEAPMPIHPPLASSVEAGVFGREEDGSTVNPNHEEIDEITQDLAERLQELPDDSPLKAELFKQYADDFGAEAAAMLDEWIRRQERLDDNLKTDEYDPGHPWHYYHEGDNADVVPVDQIPAAPLTPVHLGVKLPRDAAKRRNKLNIMLEDATRQLKQDEQRYEELTDRGVEALSRYDREIAHGGDDDLAWASAIALKYNHIRYGRGRVSLLAAMLNV